MLNIPHAKEKDNLEGQAYSKIIVGSSGRQGDGSSLVGAYRRVGE